MSPPHEASQRPLLGAWRLRLPPQTVAGDDSRPDDLFGTPAARVDGTSPTRKANTTGKSGLGMRGEALGLVEGRRRVDEASEAPEQTTADRRPSVNTP